MPLKMRPAGLGHGVYKDVPDYGVFCSEGSVQDLSHMWNGPPELEPFMKDGAHLQTGKPFEKFGGVR
jgi:hypothetical protein